MEWYGQFLYLAPPITGFPIAGRWLIPLSIFYYEVTLKIGFKSKDQYSFLAFTFEKKQSSAKKTTSFPGEHLLH
jgi:hypothetical protein